MKTRILYFFLLAALLVSACSRNTAVVTIQPVKISATQTAEISPTVTEVQNQVLVQISPTAVDNRQGQPSAGGTPPQAAMDACKDKSEQAVCEFTSNKGVETGVCETVQAQLACSPKRDTVNVNSGQSGPNDKPDGGEKVDASNSAYSTEQAISDKAQKMTIAFDALAFLTGNLGSDSFFPPGKVADFWGFQYLRDNDPSQMGHAGDFLTSAAMNMLYILTSDQRAELVDLAEKQVDSIAEYGYKRFILMDAFRRLMDGDLPAGTIGLNEEAVKAYSAELYQLDGAISFARAEKMGNLLNSMDVTQRAYLDGMVGKGMLEWPVVEEPSDIRGLDRDVKVAVMTYAADMFSWYAGSPAADEYFCPERHGTYFGSFYLKDMPAMGNPEYAIPTNLTGDMGEAMLAALSPDQSQLITGLVDIQKPYLLEIVNTREQVSMELRKFLAGESADNAAIMDLMKQYGELDGTIIYNFAVNFAQVNQTLTEEQKSQIMALRKEMLGDLMYPDGAYLYSQAISMPEIPNTDFLFK